MNHETQEVGWEQLLPWCPHKMITVSQMKSLKGDVNIEPRCYFYWLMQRQKEVFFPSLFGITVSHPAKHSAQNWQTFRFINQPLALFAEPVAKRHYLILWWKTRLFSTLSRSAILTFIKLYKNDGKKQGAQNVKKWLKMDPNFVKKIKRGIRVNQISIINWPKSD